jgi:hypothetical protein
MIGATSKRRMKAAEYAWRATLFRPTPKTTVLKTPGGPEQKFFGTFFSKK